MENKEKIGKQISRLRKKKNLTQKEFADIMHVSFQAVSKWERGVSLPDLDTLYEVSKNLGKHFNYFLFDAYSALGLEELIEDINTYGITGKNYRSIGALCRSGVLSKEVIEMFSDKIIKETLNEVLNHIDEFNSFSDLKMDHKIVNMYSSKLQIDFIMREEIVNNIHFKHIIIDSKYDTIIYPKLLSRILGNEKNTFLFMVLVGENSINYLSKCSNDLVGNGINCFFITEMALKSNIKISVLGGGSGGGLHGHAGFHTKKNDIRDKHQINSMRLIKEYLENYNRDYNIYIG